MPTADATMEYGKNFDKEILSVNPDGSQTVRHKILSYERIQSDGKWVDYVFSDNPAYLEINTATNTVRLDKDTCGFSFHNSTDLLFQDSIIAFSSIVDQYTWSQVTQVNNAACEAYYNESEKSLVAKKHAAGIGFMEYKYIFEKGKWKTQLEATNLTNLTNRVFAFDQTINLNRDTINFGGQQRNLDNFDGQNFNRIWLENNQARVIDFLNGIDFDFDLGFEYLDSVNVIDSGVNSSQLVFHYMRNNEVLLPNETLVIDPTYGPTSGTIYNAQTTTGTGTSCPAWSGSITSANNYIQLGASSGSQVCRVGSYEWDITSIAAADSISDVDLTYDVTMSGGAWNKNCYFMSMEHAPSSYGTSANLKDDIINGTSFANSSDCQATGNNYTIDLGASADADVLANVGEGWWGVGIWGNTLTRDTTNRFTEFTVTELTIVYSTIPNPDAVDDLSSPSQSYGSVDLLWTEPGLNGETLLGYQINYSTPWGQPLTIITNNTGTSTTSTTVSGLSIATDYSFRVSAWTAGGNNATGNILNVTTQGNFTIGTALFNQTNTSVLPITFEEQAINSTATFLNVTYANTFNLSCDFYYQFANTNNTYANLTGYAVSSTLDETYFILTDFENEIINIECYDSITGTDANYLMTQSDFPLLQQIANFRNGTYGTMGLFGVFDLVTIAVVIFSMIGLNRVNESVGAVFNIILLGSLAYFEIIELPTVIFGVLTLVIIFVITSTKKD